MEDRKKHERDLLIYITVTVVLALLGKFVNHWFNVLAALSGVMAISEICTLFFSPDALEERKRKKEELKAQGKESRDALDFLKESSFALKKEDIQPQLDDLKKKFDEGSLSEKEYLQQTQALKNLINEK